MEIINVDEEQKEIWNKFIAENCSESFLQSWEWGEFQKSLGRKIWRIGIVEDDLLAVALIVKYDLPFGWSYFYCPRGPVVKISNIKYQISNILDFLFSEIKKISKKEKSLFLRIDPLTPLAPILSRGEREHASPFKKKTGEISAMRILKKSPNEIQPRDTLILDITKSEEELLKEMKQKTRYNIRLAGKKELRIRNYELGIDNKENFKEKFEKFWELIKETSQRDKFVSHSKNYYWKMLENLVNKKQDTRYKNQKNINNQTSKNKRNLQARLYLAEYSNKIIAANMVLYFGDMAVYLHGASSNEYRNVMAPYLLQWRQIMDAKEAGCKKYDFWGVSSEVAEAERPIGHSASWGGITKFKKGFGGYEKNYIGAYDLAFNNIGYPIYGFMRKIKSFLIFL
ncbi:MAG: peptidoglycan bridge formation glycyltransferase FemA/FemB family protein [Candidatus Pacebacteria bacterium]|nr:peptidoglycan bridge formation glycyltransferase FemA/FemB family protein [Candidatus Paceibacterota bacterium]